MVTSQISREIVEDVERLLRTVGQIIKKRGREILSDFEITPPQFDALLILIQNGVLTIGELGEKMYLACSTATDLVDRMERNGLVMRERDALDRRVIRLRVLDRGHQMLAEVMAARKRYLAEVLVKVSPEENRAMIVALTHLSELMAQEEVS
ncbi:MAG: putative HTH-type transcriptional regulator YusO [Firmicutes bacterium]|nr:putative HTH-type transcriptional regulator YusO [Bacillota bacterium]MBT9157510.1 putative HTH-type transcriptional regulator YusO [Bacillota bacterium]